MPSDPSRNVPDLDVSDYVTHVVTHLDDLQALGYVDLLAQLGQPSVFLSLAYWQAMHNSDSATADKGWDFRCVAVTRNGRLCAACPGYLKMHSAGEYVFDHSWAHAYEQHGLAYYPKFIGAPAFTPVPGPRLLAVDEPSRVALMHALETWATEQQLSSMHLLFCTESDANLATQNGWMRRDNVQFHWFNRSPLPYRDFGEFLAQLNHEKRKKIRQEQNKVKRQGVYFETRTGTQISKQDWAYFYACYQQTYWEHGRAPYLTPAFFEQVSQHMPDNWLLVLALRDGQPIACSLSGISQDRKRLYGRYWGALARVDCLHFDVCYYQPIEWCINNGIEVFEGGAQGEHKMARALLPVATQSVHWIAHPQFSQAIARFLERERPAVQDYLMGLTQRSPFKSSDDAGDPLQNPLGGDPP